MEGLGSDTGEVAVETRPGPGVGGREPGETTSRQVVAGEASTNLGHTDRHTQGNHEDREHENRLDLVKPGSQSVHRGIRGGLGHR